ncbi:hypothetical protein FCL47_02995 [Desulfopila sp. IMCC35006]|uniref:hypothetical protein n=1 Tax=Desulfopila sp. IMCC35006 TaxID=2569542 RepID=UPI0010ACBB78|nr:hypothetical protein [Desulfopila sp. IMCC35006]TKB28467.1 hypothetical protein FCL47_02995 [Desulfopila sp. IMCC35006]
MIIFFLTAPDVSLLNQGVSCSFPGRRKPIRGGFTAAVHGCRDPKNEQLTPFHSDRQSFWGKQNFF